MKHAQDSRRLMVAQRRAVRNLPRVGEAELRPLSHNLLFYLDGGGLSPVGVTPGTKFIIRLTEKPAPGELGAIEYEDCRGDTYIGVGYVREDERGARCDWPGGVQGRYRPGARIIGKVVAIVGEKPAAADDAAAAELEWPDLIV